MLKIYRVSSKRKVFISKFPRIHALPAGHRPYTWELPVGKVLTAPDLLGHIHLLSVLLVTVFKVDLCNQINVNGFKNIFSAMTTYGNVALQKRYLLPWGGKMHNTKTLHLDSQQYVLIIFLLQKTFYDLLIINLLDQWM